MSERVKAILDSARDLSAPELELVIDGLAERLEGSPGSQTTEDEFEAELDRRAAEYLRNPNVASRWKDFDWDEPD